MRDDTQIATASTFAPSLAARVDIGSPRLDLMTVQVARLKDLLCRCLQFGSEGRSRALWKTGAKSLCSSGERPHHPNRGLRHIHLHRQP